MYNVALGCEKIMLFTYVKPVTLHEDLNLFSCLTH